MNVRKLKNGILGIIMEETQKVMPKKTKAELIKAHFLWHKSLDKLVACYLEHSDKNLHDTNLMEFMEWSFQQTVNPVCFNKQNNQ